MSSQSPPPQDREISATIAGAASAGIGAEISQKGVGRLFRNTFALALGRNLNALSRLVVASLIVRGLGAESFGIYSVIVALLAIADWILDFGTTDVFVREIVKSPGRYVNLRRSLVALKLLQAPAAMILMLAMLLAMQHSAAVLLAGLIAGTSITLFAGVAVYRTIFKATLTMEREMVAEFVSVLALIPLIFVTVRFDLGTFGLMWSIVGSRAVFLFGCFVLAREERSLSFSGVTTSEIVWLARSSKTIGTIGLLIVINNAIEIILLSNLASFSDVALFSAAQKLVWPTFMVLGAIGTSYYPLLAAQLPKSKEQFNRSCQQAFDFTLIAGGLSVCGLYCGARFLLSLLGPDLLPAAEALRVLAVMCVVKSIAAVLGPTLYIAGAQRHAFVYFSIALAIKAVLIAWVAPRFGFLGTAYVTLAIESLLVTPVTLYYVWYFTGFKPAVSTAAAVIAITAGSVAVSSLALPSGSLESAVLAGTIYCALILSFRVVDLRAVTQLLHPTEHKAIADGRGAAHE